MRWLDVVRAPCGLTCAYCGETGRFAHARSFEHEDGVLSLFRCSGCRSLLYDLDGVEIPVISRSDAIGAEAMRNARYVFETGFSARHVAMCALSALPDLAEQDLRGHVFVDIGAGLGMASYFVKRLIGMPTLTVEPSFTGKIAQDVLGLEVHRVYFEDLPETVLAPLRAAPCCLHLNSVVEHLADPFATLAQVMRRIEVRALAVVVPDADALDLDGPFVNALPYLAPRDHRHLPSRSGLERMLRRLGFAHVHVAQDSARLTAVGARAPVRPPSDRETRLAASLLLEHLLRHPEPMVAEGAASRLLPEAVLTDNAPLIATLAARFDYERDVATLLERIARRAWDELPFHLGPTCYWLAADALAKGRIDGALALLKVPPRFADLIVADYPHLAMSALEFKWAAVLLEANLLRHIGSYAAAERALQSILDSQTDASAGAGAAHRATAQRELEALRAVVAMQRRGPARPGVLASTS